MHILSSCLGQFYSESQWEGLVASAESSVGLDFVSVWQAIVASQQGGGGPIGDEVLLEVVAGPQCDCWGGWSTSVYHVQVVRNVWRSLIVEGVIRKCKAGDSGLRGVTCTLHKRGLMLIWSTSYQTIKLMVKKRGQWQTQKWLKWYLQFRAIWKDDFKYTEVWIGRVTALAWWRTSWWSGSKVLARHFLQL